MAFSDFFCYKQPYDNEWFASKNIRDDGALVNFAKILARLHFVEIGIAEHVKQLKLFQMYHN